MAKRTLLTSTQMATFAARGFLRFDGVVPAALNEAFLAPLERADDDGGSLMARYGRLMGTKALPAIDSGTRWRRAFPKDSVIGALLRLPVLRGAIDSLVGRKAVVDHHFMHLRPPPADGETPQAQHYHQDSTIDTRRAFDIQLFYFPHAITGDMGGTRFLPGSHLRQVSESAITRYQNIRGQERVQCAAGTVLILHHGIWHGGGANASDRSRFLWKLRLCPQQPQQRLWNLSDLPADHLRQRPTFWIDPSAPVDPVHRILTTPEPWFEADTARLEYIARVRLWRYLLGDERFDADYWVTRIENDY
ncbi:MAG: phytanoyl-CoA dioxygenase family protein [Pseudomonadota bacterium]